MNLNELRTRIAEDAPIDRLEAETLVAMADYYKAKIDLLQAKIERTERLLADATDRLQTWEQKINEEQE